MKQQNSETQKFLSTVYREIENNYILVWAVSSSGKKQSTWHGDHKSAAAHIESLPDNADVYYGPGLSSKDWGPHARCRQKDIGGIVGLWLDVDIKNPAHSKPNLPESIEEAMKLLKGFELWPTIIINSGHGLQALWLFKEVWTFDDDSERQEAASLERNLIYHFKKIASQYGWDVDSVHNLDRVLRVPGTMNCKAEPVPVKLIECNDIRYNPSDFEDILPEAEEADYKAEVIEGELILKPGAKLNMSKFEALSEVEQKFKLSWEHKRKDLQDQSASSYDLALVNYAAKAGWNQQEMADLIIAHREKYSIDLKLRQDYYQRTISIALKNAEKFRVDEEKTKVDEEIAEITALEPDHPIEISDEQRAALLKKISTRFNIRIDIIVKYKLDEPVFELYTSFGEIKLGDVNYLIKQDKLRSKLASLTRKMIPYFKPNVWSDYAQQLLNCCIEQDVGEEATERGQAQAWLEQYLASKTLLNDPAAASVSGDPFKQDGNTYIFLRDFVKWVRIMTLEKLDSRKAAFRLRKAGLVSVPINVKNGGAWTTRRAWKIPWEL
jgi:hypothetical protein